MLKFSKSQIKKEMRQLYAAPSPQRKEEFLRDFPYPRTGWMETIAVQAGYIHKSIWVLSLLLVVGALMMGEHLSSGGSYAKIWCMSGVMPLLAVLAVTEAFRSSVYGMAELEMASKHNLPQILLIRMGVMGGVDFFLTVLGILLIVGREFLGLFRTAVYLVVPWLCTCILALQIEKYAKGRETIWYCAACGCLLCGGSMIGGQIRRIVYESGKFYLWIIALCVFAVCFTKQIWQLRNETEEWNLYFLQ